MYKNTRFCENQNIAQFNGVGDYDFPQLAKDDVEECEFIGFNYAKTSKNRHGKGIHFFLDDYQFERVWRSPERYVDLLSQFKCVLTPDFSLYTDYPKALQIYAHYKKQWCGAFWQSQGIKVIPTICWSDANSYDFCFEGIEKGGTVAVSTIGCLIGRESKRLFLNGYEQMKEVVKPKDILLFGGKPKEITDKNIRIIEPYYIQIRKRVSDGR